MADSFQEWLSSLQPASFGGFVFGVAQHGDKAGHAVAEQAAIGVGYRVLRQALQLQPATFSAYLSSFSGEGAQRTPRNVFNDIARFKEVLNDPRPQTLIHPWQGALTNHLCTDATFEVGADEVRYVRMDLVFAPAEFPLTVPEPANIPQDGKTARATMTDQSEGYADELVPFDELSLVALQLDTTGDSDEDTATATSAKLLNDANIGATGVPGAIQRLGNATRVVDAGEYTVGDRSKLYAELLNLAASRNSPTLLNMLQTFKLLLSDLGSGALAQSATVTAGTLQSLAVATGADPRVLASRNRQSVKQWFPRGTIQL